ncbi:MAG: hydroxyacid dehydrogenase [Clostridia bacterium]|nr:hydroxyacid dehydrogenase [Clostridia bacterium]
MKILVTVPEGPVRTSFFPPHVCARLEALGEVEYNTTGRNYTPDELREHLMGKDVALTGWGTGLLDEYVLEGNDTLKLLAHTGGAVTPVASDYLYDKGIRVISGNRLYAESVAEAVIAYALASLRRIPEFTQRSREGGWYEGEIWEGLLDQTVGIVGFGMISKSFMKLGKTFRLKFKVVDKPYITEEDKKEYGFETASIEEVFSTCKIISIHSAMTDKTYHMVNERLLSMIPDGALLINTARGPVIDEQALIRELEKKRFNAVLDVYEAQEPLPLDYPLRHLDNVICIPHMGGPTYDRRQVVTMALADDIENFFRGGELKQEISRTYASRQTSAKST